MSATRSGYATCMALETRLHARGCSLRLEISTPDSRGVSAVIPKRTTTPARTESGVPLGGIGAGKIEFCADGRFTNVTTNNNLDCPITDGLARTPLFPRIKEGAEGSVLENSIR